MANQTTGGVVRTAATTAGILGGFSPGRPKEGMQVTYQGRSPQEREAFVKTPEGAHRERRLREQANVRFHLATREDIEQQPYA